MISPEQYKTFKAASANQGDDLIMKLHAESKKRWGKVYEALAK